MHLSFFPKADEALIDEKAEERMDLVRTLVGLGRGTREKERIKVRQPLKEILVDGKYESIIGDLTPLIKDELNIKDVLFESKLDAYMNYSLKPNFKVAGPVLGKNTRRSVLRWHRQIQQQRLPHWKLTGRSLWISMANPWRSQRTW